MRGKHQLNYGFFNKLYTFLLITAIDCSVIKYFNLLIEPFVKRFFALVLGNIS